MQKGYTIFELVVAVAMIFLVSGVIVDLLGLV